MADFRLDDAALGRLLVSPSGPVVGDITRRCKRVESAAKVYCPVDVGRLRSSIATEVGIVAGSVVGRVGTNVEYALAVHNGTGIYGPAHRRIVPVRAKRLSWVGRGGKRIYAKSVAGSPGRPFLRRALPSAAG